MTAYDTIVIGAGLAGLIAALRHAEQGQRVLLLAKGYGTTHWTAGCIDVLDAPETGDDPSAAIEALTVCHPTHPYASAGLANLVAALDRLRALCEAANYPLVGDLRRNVRLPTAVGALRPTCLLPAVMAAGDARQLPRAGSVHGTLVAGFRELRDFFPPLLAANLAVQGYAAQGAYLELPPTGRKRDFTSLTLARLFDQPEFRAHVGRQLRRLVKQNGYSHIALPAVLGLEHAPEVVRDLQAAAGALVFEVPTLPPSVPGIRLLRVLERAVIQAGGRLQIGAFVTQAKGRDGRLESVSTAAAARQQRHHAERFVLATGGIAGGGLRAEPSGELRETALGLPVRAPEHRAAWFSPRVLDGAGHPAFRAGVAVDRRFRPLDLADGVAYTNVVVIGAALAGVDPVREACLEGLALATAWAASDIG